MYVYIYIDTQLYSRSLKVRTKLVLSFTDSRIEDGGNEVGRTFSNARTTRTTCVLERDAIIGTNDVPMKERNGRSYWYEPQSQL